MWLGFIWLNIPVRVHKKESAPRSLVVQSVFDVCLQLCSLIMMAVGIFQRVFLILGKTFK
jgi:hypothetical protein